MVTDRELPPQRLSAQQDLARMLHVK
jgi:hypothetical protein